MPISRLRRVDFTLYRRTTSTSAEPIPLARTPVYFYRQGATVSSASVTIANGATALVEVYDKGKLEDGSTVMATGAGPELSVSSVESPTELLVQNTSGSAVTLRRGMRLILLSDPPELYADPFGTEPLGDSVSTDSNGRLLAYIDEDWFDYVTTGDPVTLDAASSESITDATNEMAWNHVVSGEDRILLVGVSWQDSDGTESIQSVEFANQALTLLGTLNEAAIYYLVGPPVGLETVVVTWSGSNQKGAVGGAVSFSGVHQFSPLGSMFSASNNTNAPSVVVTGTDLLAAVFDTLAVALGISGTSATAPAGQIQQWNASAGSTPFLTRTLGAGSVEAGSGGPVTMSWALGTAKPWTLLAVQVKPSALVAIDVPGAELQQSAFGVNVCDFQSIQDAIDSLPDEGGTIFIPAGEYLVGPPEGSPEQTAALIVNKPVTIRGEGPMATRIKARDVNPWYDVMEVTGTQFNLSGLTIDGNAEYGEDIGVSCLRVHATDITRLIIGCYLESVICLHAGGTGIVLSELLGTVAINCESGQHRRHGIRVQIDPPPGSPDTRVGGNTYRFISCTFSDNDGKGAEVFSVWSVQFVACSFAHNRGGLLGTQGQAIDVDFCRNVLMSGCYFESGSSLSPDPIAQQFIRVNDSYCVVVDSCTFGAHFGTPLRCALFEDSNGARFTSNIAWDTGGGAVEPLAEFRDSPDGVEYGNVRIGSEDEFTQARVLLEGASRPSLTQDVWINAGNFQSIQAAIDVLPPRGGVVYIPEGVHPIESPLLLPLDKPVQLIGAGPGMTVLSGVEGSPAMDAVVRIRSEYQAISNLSIESSGTSIKGLLIGRYVDESYETPLMLISVRNCEIYGSGGWAMYCIGEDEGDPVQFASVDGLRISWTSQPGGGGIRLGDGCRDWNLINVREETGTSGTSFFLLDGAENVDWQASSFVSPLNSSHGGIGLIRDSVAVRLARCDFRFEDVDITSWPQLRFEGDNLNVTIDSSRFKRLSANSGTVEIEVDEGATVRGFVMVNLLFEKPSSSTNEVILRAGGDLELTGGAVVLTDLSPPGIVPVRIDDATIGSGNSLRYAGVVGIGTRVRLPAYVASEITNLPDARRGDLVFDLTNSAVKVYNGTGWVTV